MDDASLKYRELIPLLRHQAWLVLVASMIFFTNLGNYTLFNDDEAKNTVCATEMFRRGDVIVPTFYEELRTDKPILLYWLMLTSFKFFGISEFSARLASSLLSVGTVLVTYHLGRKLYTAKIGFLAGLILSSCLLFSAVGRAATPDSALIFFVTLAFTAFVWVVARQRHGNFRVDDNQPSEESSTSDADTETLKENPVDNSDSILRRVKQLIRILWKYAVPFYGAMGMAVLAKGPVGLILPCVSVLLFLLISKRERDLNAEKLKPIEGIWWRRWIVMAAQVLRPRVIVEAAQEMHLLIGLGIVTAVALPWYLAVGFKTNGAWLQGFLLDHNLGRALLPKENHNGFPFFQLYQLVALHVGCFPWSVFLPVALYRMKQRFEEDAEWRDSDRLLACWAGVWFVVFSLVSTRLPNYLLPMYPAVALILARYFHDWEQDEVDSGVYSFNLCCYAMGIVGILAVIGVYIAAFLLFDGEQWLSLICAIPIIGAFVAVKFLDRELRQRVMQTLIGMALLLAFVIVGIAPPSISKHQDTPKFFADMRRFSRGEDFEVGTYKYFQPTVLFYAGKKIPVLKTPRQVADFITRHPHAFVITRPSELNELRNELTGDANELSRHRNFLHRDELILIGRP
jgi:4-amino-4-deoxy-L-arabinose transferase-like glycosyltransferase